MSGSFATRPGTYDEHVFESVVGRNEYRLPEAFGPDDVIVDIGLHIGSFSYAALNRGAACVYGFEANPANFEWAARNLRPFGDRVRLHQKAVWRSDRPVARLAFTPNADNNAAGHVLLADGSVEVEAVAFDDVIRDVTRGGRRRVRLLKMDCEGSEFPILLTARTLHLIDEIVGEYHEYGLGDGPHNIPEPAQVAGHDRFTLASLTDVLARAGLRTTEVRRHPDPTVPTGVFWASREAQPSLLGRLKAGWRRLRRPEAA